MKTSYSSVVYFVFLAIAGHPVAAATIEVIDPGVGDFPLTVCAYNVVEYSDASIGGGDWTVTGSGNQGGTASQLWLFSTSLLATTQLTEVTTAVAFMMQNDSNDGIARFRVDGNVEAEIDMFSSLGTSRTVVISDLLPGAHELSVQYTGGRAGIAILGGGALVLSLQGDVDADGVVDAFDNCIATANPDQRDSDSDGFGNVCDADFNNDCAVDFEDLGQLKAVFFGNDANADLDGDGVVNFFDLGIIKSAFFGTPGQSGLTSVCGCE